jgi:hypothetical protein
MRAMRSLVVRAIFIATGELCPGITVVEWRSTPLTASRIGEAANYNTMVRRGMRGCENVLWRSCVLFVSVPSVEV